MFASERLSAVFVKCRCRIDGVELQCDVDPIDSVICTKHEGKTTSLCACGGVEANPSNMLVAPVEQWEALQRFHEEAVVCIQHGEGSGDGHAFDALECPPSL